MTYKDPARQKEYQRQHYLKYKAMYDAKNKRKRLEFRLFLDTLKTECSKCGYNECKQALHFHHINGEKKFILSEAKGMSHEQIREEADKCEIICANCHAKEHCKR